VTETGWVPGKERSAGRGKPGPKSASDRQIYAGSNSHQQTPIYGFVMSMIILKLIGVSTGLRVTLEEEREGLDISLNGESVG
jgi:ammonia channel protein AmtB